MSNLERVKRAVEMAAVQADHYPEGHGWAWGKDINGEWVYGPTETALPKVGEFG